MIKLAWAAFLVIELGFDPITVTAAWLLIASTRTAFAESPNADAVA